MGCQTLAIIFGSQRTEKLFTVLSYDMVYNVFIMSVCVTNEGVLAVGFRPLCRSLWSVSEPLVKME